MVDPTRLELVTFSMSRKRSNQLSYGSLKVGGEGLEPSQPYGHRILSPTCIPIPPPAQNLHSFNEFNSDKILVPCRFLNVSQKIDLALELPQYVFGGEDRNRTGE